MFWKMIDPKINFDFNSLVWFYSGSATETFLTSVWLLFFEYFLAEIGLDVAENEHSYEGGRTSRARISICLFYFLSFFS